MQKLSGDQMTDIKATLERSCWNCEYRRDIEGTFLGVCTWFEVNSKGQNKDIPPPLVDKGCKHWNGKDKLLKKL